MSNRTAISAACGLAIAAGVTTHAISARQKAAALAHARWASRQIAIERQTAAQDKHELACADLWQKYRLRQMEAEELSPIAYAKAEEKLLGERPVFCAPVQLSLTQTMQIANDEFFTREADVDVLQAFKKAASAYAASGRLQAEFVLDDVWSGTGWFRFLADHTPGLRGAEAREGLTVTPHGLRRRN